MVFTESNGKTILDQIQYILALHSGRLYLEECGRCSLRTRLIRNSTSLRFVGAIESRVSQSITLKPTRSLLQGHFAFPESI